MEELFDVLRLGPKFFATGILLRAVVQFVKGFPFIGDLFNTPNRVKTLVGVVALVMAKLYQVDVGSAAGLTTGVGAVDIVVSASLLSYWAMFLHDKLNGNNKKVTK